jgi:hypothetical protein
MMHCNIIARPIGLMTGPMILYGKVNAGLMHGLMKGPIEVL